MKYHCRNQFYKLIGNDLQLNTKLCYNELNITAIFKLALGLDLWKKRPRYAI